MTRTQKCIGKYRLVEELSSGSFGRVYRAEDTSRNKAQVALKLLHAAHVSSQQERNAFLQEARFLTLLRHPHILQVLDVGIEQDFPYLVTEYAPNGSLLTRLQQIASHSLPLNDALHILTQVAQALQYAHQQNIIHRDLKPANILFHANGDALLADFGIATMLANSSEHGSAIGTPFYMAPEQFRGTISKESDQYALGCIAYELVTGRQPFNAPDFFSLGYKHMSEIPIAPSQLNLLVTRPVENAILRAMAKQRGDRFPDIASFMDALGAPLSNLAPLAFPILSAAAQSSIPGEESEEGILAPYLADEEDTGKLPRVAMLSSSRPSTGSPLFTPVPGYGGEDDTPGTFSPADSLPREVTGNTFTVRRTMPFTPLPLSEDNEEEFSPFPSVMEEPSLLTASSEEDELPPPALQPAVLPLATATIPPPLPVRRRRRRIWFIVAAALCLFLLLGGSAFAALYLTNSSFRHNATAITSAIRKHLPVVAPPPPQVIATVTITPVKKNLSYDYNILAVSSPNSALQQVSARYLSSVTGWQSRTIPATGKGTIPATRASGTLYIYNYGPNVLNMPQGLTFPSQNGPQTVYLGSAVSIQVNASTTVEGFASNTGSQGNVGVNYFHSGYTWNGETMFMQNTTPLSGGQDAQTYTYLQSSDMLAVQNAANQLEISLTASARSGVLGQIYSGESLYGSVQCSSIASYNHHIGDRVSSVTASVSAKCSAEVYNQQAALTMGANLLSQKVSSVPSASYKLISRIATYIVSVTGVRGGIQIVVNAASVGLFQFSKGQQQELASLIVGKSEQEAQTILASQTGVGNVKITLANTTGSILPTSAKDITINVVGG